MGRREARSGVLETGTREEEVVEVEGVGFVVVGWGLAVEVVVEVGTMMPGSRRCSS